MVNHLVIPDQFAGAGIQREQTIAIQVRSWSIGAVEIVFRTRRRNIDDAALHIQSHAAPIVGASDRLPRIFWPGLITRLARMGNGMERPRQAAGADVVSANVTRTRVVFLVCGG